MRIIILSTLLMLASCKKAPSTTSNYKIPPAAVAIGSDTTLALPLETTPPVGGTTTVKEHQ